MPEPLLDVNTLYQMLLKISEEVASRLSAIDRKVAVLSEIVGKAADSKSMRQAIVLLEKNIGGIQTTTDNLQRQLALYMDRDRLVNHNHDGLSSKKVSFTDLENNDLSAALAGKAPIERGYDRAGQGSTGVAVSFQDPYAKAPLVIPVLQKSDLAAARLVVRTDISVTPVGFIFRAYAADQTEIKNLSFSYLVWKLSA